MPESKSVLEDNWNCVTLSCTLESFSEILSSENLDIGSNSVEHSCL